MAIANVIQTLVAHEAEFIRVGGMAAVLRSAPVLTIDLDIVYALSESNVVLLELALTELGTAFRGDPRRRCERFGLQSRRHELLQTTAGPLEALATIG